MDKVVSPIAIVNTKSRAVTSATRSPRLRTCPRTSTTRNTSLFASMPTIEFLASNWPRSTWLLLIPFATICSSARSVSPGSCGTKRITHGSTVQTICLGVTGQDCQTIHVVAEGDFCASIADVAGIDVSTLLANNPNVNSDCSNIGIGEVSPKIPNENDALLTRPL